MRGLKSSLLALRFAADNTGRLLTRGLFADYVVELAPDGRWAIASELYFYVKSKRFSGVMSRLFRESAFPFRSYVDRKLRQDESGTLAMAMAFVDYSEKSFTFMSANVHVTTERLDELLDRMSSPQGAYEVLYESEMANFLADIEGLWVYLYLATERGLEPPAIIAELAANPKLASHVRRWRLARAVDRQVIEEFQREYRAASALVQPHMATTE